MLGPLFLLLHYRVKDAFAGARGNRYVKSGGRGGRHRTAWGIKGDQHPGRAMPAVYLVDSRCGRRLLVRRCEGAGTFERRMLKITSPAIVSVTKI